MTPEQEAKCRDWFERDYVQRYNLVHLPNNDSNGIYLSAHAQNAWELCQAAWSAAQAQQVDVEEVAQKIARNKNGFCSTFGPPDEGWQRHVSDVLDVVKAMGLTPIPPRTTTNLPIDLPGEPQLVMYGGLRYELKEENTGEYYVTTLHPVRSDDAKPCQHGGEFYVERAPASAVERPGRVICCSCGETLEWVPWEQPSDKEGGEG